MARPPQIRPEELTPDTPGRIKLVTWPDYQEELSDEDSRKYVFVTIFRPTDTILYATTEVRLLWWELVRLSGAGRNKGWVVLGKNSPITPRQIADILHLDLKTVVMPGLIGNMKEGRVIINSAKPLFNSEKPPFNESDSAAGQQTQDPARVHEISKEKRSKEKGREEETAAPPPPPENSTPEQEEKEYRWEHLSLPERALVECWDGLYRQWAEKEGKSERECSWGKFDAANLTELLAENKRDRILAVMFYYFHFGEGKRTTKFFGRNFADIMDSMEEDGWQICRKLLGEFRGLNPHLFQTT